MPVDGKAFFLSLLCRKIHCDFGSFSQLAFRLDSAIVYKITYDAETSEFAQIKKDDDGDITLTVENGDLHDTITVESSGKLLLDNKEVSIGNI